jgi:TIR domain
MGGRGHQVRRHVFISHASENKPRIRPIAQKLLYRGFDVWIDEPRNFDPRLKHERLHRIRTYEAWANSIADNIAEAGCVLVVWSQNSVQRHKVVVWDEARRALGRQILVSVTIDPVERQLPTGFAEMHATPLTRELADLLEGRTAELDIDDVIDDVQAVILRRAPAVAPASVSEAASAFNVEPFAGQAASTGAGAGARRLRDPLVTYMLDRDRHAQEFVATVSRALRSRGGARRPCVFLLAAPYEERPGGPRVRLAIPFGAVAGLR